jgi:hypothetical protein
MDIFHKKQKYPSLAYFTLLSPNGGIDATWPNNSLSLTLLISHTKTNPWMFEAQK